MNILEVHVLFLSHGFLEQNMPRLLQGWQPYYDKLCCLNTGLFWKHWMSYRLGHADRLNSLLLVQKAVPYVISQHRSLFVLC